MSYSDNKENSAPTTPKLYVGNLSYTTTEENLREFIKDKAPDVEIVKVTIIMDRERDNQSKGFGFVELANLEQAVDVVARCHKQPLGGRDVNVTGAREQGERPRRSSGGFGGDRGGRSGGGGGGGGFGGKREGGFGGDRGDRGGYGDNSGNKRSRF